MKSKSTKSQFYRYTLRTAGSVGSFCASRVYIYIVPPQGAISIENLFLHFRMVFDSAVTSDLRVIESIGVANERPLLYTGTPSELKKFDLNQAADGNRRVDIKLDLTTLLNKDNVGFTSLLSADYTIGDQTHIQIKVPDQLLNTVAVGTIELCKVDAIFTTSEIR